jgi:hypothetical protein
LSKITGLKQGAHIAYIIPVALALFLTPQSFAAPVAMFMHESMEALNPQVEVGDQKPPMVIPTQNGLYRIEMTWEPIEIKPNQIVNFNLKIMDASNKVAENVRYDFVVLKDYQPIKELESSFAIDGIATHTVEFPSAGSFRVIVKISSVDGVKLKESVAFDLKVVPEFPVSTIIVMATLVGITIALTRFTIMNRTGNTQPAVT